MAFLFQKFQEAVKTLARSPLFARDPRHLQFEADVNRLFLYTSYNRLGKNADEKDVNEIIDMASKASVADQQKQVQENIHLQIKNICRSMDDILICDLKSIPDSPSSAPQLQNGSRWSGLGFATGRGVASTKQSAQVVPETRPLTRLELSQRLKDHIGYTLEVKPSQIHHEEAGQGLFITGEADVGAVIAFYPGVIYSPAYYQNIPGYPRIDASNSYLITRYDGIVINAQPWGIGGETRQVWDGFYQPGFRPNPSKDIEERSDRFWRMLSKPLESNYKGNYEVVERRNPLAFGHFANHPPEGTIPNVMLCPYDFPITEKEMRPYIPNLVFGSEENVTMKRFGTFWFRSRGSGDCKGDIAVLKTIVLVTTRDLSDEELFLNYRLSNQKRRPVWYTPVDEEEDRRRWS
ncbi:uncharacterized protein LOC103711937 [Phoenix dactylifera]|uniref:Uncharacterized protein LOC103711937 n=1 Tax=Phoenix dactylifera TaxID=42345 RepID=A0A8B7CD37_PHODC|nr:uncharacterized protein LOC103711937 [Phoenix dactylifera]